MPQTVSTVRELAGRVAQDAALADELRRDPAGTLTRLAGPLESDRLIYRVVVFALAGAVIVCLVGSLGLAWVGKDVPDGVIALGSAAIGALAGLLAPSPARS